jgi:hypothetical protein
MEWSSGEFSQISRKLASRRFPAPLGMKTQGVIVPSAQMPAAAVALFGDSPVGVAHRIEGRQDFGDGGAAGGKWFAAGRRVKSQPRVVGGWWVCVLSLGSGLLS